MQSPFPNFVQYVAKWACPTQGVYNTFLHVESPSFPSAKLLVVASDEYSLSGKLSLCSEQTSRIPNTDVISVVFELLSPAGQHQPDLPAGACLTQDSLPQEKQKRDETCTGTDYVGSEDEGSSRHNCCGEKGSIKKRYRAASVPEEMQQPTNRHKIG